MSENRKDIYLPVPAAVAGTGPFVVRATLRSGASRYPRGGMGHFEAPLDNSAVSVAIRAHEYMHLMLERQGVLTAALHESLLTEGISETWIQCAADWVVWERLRMASVDPTPLRKTMPRRRKDITDVEHIMRYLQFRRPEVFSLRYDVSSVVNTVRDLLARTAYKNDVRAFRDAVRLLNTTWPLFDSRLPTTVEGIPTQTAEDSAEPTKRSVSSTASWGEMKMLSVPLTIPVSEAMRALNKRPSYIGALRNTYRALLPISDGRCFVRRRKAPGGTLLLDVSGSMSLTSEYIAEFVRQRPALTVACYSGPNQDNVKRVGYLCVLACNGHIADISAMKWDQYFAGYNTVDGPALRWLAKQPGPRYWISDGNVNGGRVNGHALRHISLNVECVQILRVAGITQYLSITRYLCHTPQIPPSIGWE
jgi:hypothetical protein